MNGFHVCFSSSGVHKDSSSLSGGHVGWISHPPLWCSWKPQTQHHLEKRWKWCWKTTSHSGTRSLLVDWSLIKIIESQHEFKINLVCFLYRCFSLIVNDSWILHIQLPFSILIYNQLFIVQLFIKSPPHPYWLSCFTQKHIGWQKHGYL